MAKLEITQLSTTEDSAIFRCDAVVSINTKIGFEIFDEEICSDLHQGYCYLINFGGVIHCNKIINGHTTELRCDYSLPNSVSCNFSVYDLTVNSSSVVTCFVRDDQNEVNNSAALYLNRK